jgi:hypothetical protein
MRRKPSLDQSDCELPQVVDAEVLSQFVPSEPRMEAQAIREYVEWQASESVLHLEKLKTEYVFENRYDAWDVTTTAERYWVITTPTNLYSQKYFPSLDYTITFMLAWLHASSLGSARQKAKNVIVCCLRTESGSRPPMRSIEPMKPRSFKPSACAAERRCSK